MIISKRWFDCKSMDDCICSFQLISLHIWPSGAVTSNGHLHPYWCLGGFARCGRCRLQIDGDILVPDIRDG